jgi:hypothetical protein
MNVNLKDPNIQRARDLLDEAIWSALEILIARAEKGLEREGAR